MYVPFCTVSLPSGALVATTPLSSSLERTVFQSLALAVFVENHSQKLLVLQHWTGLAIVTKDHKGRAY